MLGMIQRGASDQRLYILLHNIDGPGNSLTQMRLEA